MLCLWQNYAINCHTVCSPLVLWINLWHTLFAQLLVFICTICIIPKEAYVTNLSANEDEFFQNDGNMFIEPNIDVEATTSNTDSIADSTDTCSQATQPPAVPFVPYKKQCTRRQRELQTELIEMVHDTALKFVC